MMAAGLSIDMGYLRYQHRRMQTAADSAALAGASELGVTDWLTTSQAAFTDAGLNGFSASSGAQLTATEVACPDTTMNCVQIQVSQQLPLFFMRIVPNITAPTVSAVAVAEQKPGLGCMYALSNSPDAIEVGVGSNNYHTIVAGPNCGIVDNGGLDVQNSASHTIYTSSVGLAGTWDGDGSVTPAPVQGITQAGDPFANLSAPIAPPPCTGQSTTYVSGVFSYPCGLTISTTTNLSSGLYTVGGSGLSISGNGATVTGSGVTFYVSGPTAAVNINSVGVDEPNNLFGAVVQLQAPLDASSGGIPGVLLFQDRSDSSPSAITLAGFASGGPQPDSYLWGALYLPAATLTLTGAGLDGSGDIDKCSSVPRLTTVVANQISFHENLNFSTNDCQWPPVQVSTPVTSPNRDAVLVR
jgi:hypothetical protein